MYPIKAVAIGFVTVVCCASLHFQARAGEAEAVDAGKDPQAHYQVVYARGDGGGYHTYRIPALAVTGKGTILAFCEARKNSKADDGDIDMVVKRSFDNGKTWGPMQLIHEEGGTAAITIGNPCPIVDRETGTVHLLFCRNNKRVFITHSTDDGATWTKPVEITSEVKDSDFKGWFATGPGHGIQLQFGPHKGRLLAPAYGEGARDSLRSCRSFVIYSDDHGATWKTGGYTRLPDEWLLKSRPPHWKGPYREGAECLVTETLTGDLYMTIRNNGFISGKGKAAYAWSRDAGATWEPLQLTTNITDGGCQHGLLRLTDQKNHDKNRHIFTNPNHLTRRMTLTVRISYDNCKTWNAGKVLESERAAYSDLCLLPDMNIGCLYECGRGGRSVYDTIIFARFNLEWLTDGADSIPTKTE
jgi:sialidase-1